MSVIIWYVLSAVMHMIIQILNSLSMKMFLCIIYVNKDSSSGIGLSKNEGYLFAM